MKNFSKRLVALRKERGLTQAELAEAIHSKRTTVSGYETEGKEPDLTTICFLAEYFDVSVDYLLGTTYNRHNEQTVFFNDTANFRKRFNSLPPELRPSVTQALDSFYVLLSRDMQLCNADRLALYQKLFATLQALRAEIRNCIEASGGKISDVAEISALFSLQNELKSNVSVVLDELLQADMAASANKKIGGLPENSAM